MGKPATALAALAASRAAAVLLVALVAAGIFAPTLSHRLVWDDGLLLEHIDDRIRAGGLGALLSSEFRIGILGEPTGYYRPVVLASLWADAKLATALPVSFHLTNILLHAGVCALLLLLLETVTASLPAALAGALLFAVHPVHTEAVAFVSGRTDLWAALFALLAALVWAGERYGSRPPSPARRMAAHLGFLLGALSKEVVLLLPGILMVWDLLLPPPGQAGRGWWRRNASWLAGWALAGGLVLFLRWINGIAMGVGDAASAPVGHLETWLTYLRLLVFPWPLVTYYTSVHVEATALALAAAAGFLALCLLRAGRGSGRIGLLALLWTLAWLVPVSGLVPIRSAVVAERYLYLPSVGLALAVAGSLRPVLASPRWRPAVAAIVLPLLFLFGLGTLEQSRVWSDDLTLFSTMVRTSPAAPVAHNNLGRELGRLGRTAESAEAYRRAVALRPDNAMSRYNLGNAYLRLGRDADAVEAYREAVRLSPSHFRAHFNLGYAHNRLGATAKAEDSFRTVVRLRPGEAKPYYELGLLALARGDRQEAERCRGILEGLDEPLAQALAASIQRHRDTERSGTGASKEEP